jgi:hypothetical protein
MNFSIDKKKYNEFFLPLQHGYSKDSIALENID